MSNRGVTHKYGEAERSLVGKIDSELDKIDVVLKEVWQGTKQLANIANAQIANSAAASHQ